MNSKIESYIKRRFSLIILLVVFILIPLLFFLIEGWRVHPVLVTIQYVGGPSLRFEESVKFYKENGVEVAYNSIILNTKIRPIPEIFQYIKDERGYYRSSTNKKILLEKDAKVYLHVSSVETQKKLENGKNYDIAWRDYPGINEFKKHYSLFWQGEKELLRGIYLAFYPLCLGKTPPPDSRNINDALWVLLFAPTTLILFVIFSVVLYYRFRSKESRIWTGGLEGIFWSVVLCWIFLGFVSFLLLIPQFYRMYPWVL